MAGILDPESLQLRHDDGNISEMANGTSPKNDFLPDITMDSNFAWLLCSLLTAMIWIIYITYYHSRVLGFVLTRILNRNLFLKQGYMHVGE